MSNIFAVYDHRNRVVTRADSLEVARMYNHPAVACSYIEESDAQGSFVCMYPFWPAPQPTPPRAGIVDDITESLAYQRARVLIERAIYAMDIVEIADQAESQPQEDILSDVCRDRAAAVYSNNRSMWDAVLPTTATSEAERCIVDELTGLTHVVLARRFREVSKSLLRAAEELERN